MPPASSIPPPPADIDGSDASDLREYRDRRSEPAFTALVRRHLPLVFHAALRRLGSAALAEEAAQNAFARLAAKAPAVARHPERLRAWLHRTAFLEACTLARKEARLSRLPATPEPTRFTPMNRPEIFDRLDEALSTLPELDRELVLRRCCEGEDFRRIAAVVGKSETACQKRVERALHRLGRTLGGAGAPGLTLPAALAALAGLAGRGTSAQATGVLPSVNRVAAAALQKHAAANAASSWAGYAAGAAKAACVAAGLAGAGIGWKQAGVPYSSSVSGGVGLPASAEKATALRPAAVVAASSAAARPDHRVRSLQEVLESLQAGQLGPFLDFLPTASAADLKAVLLEDNRVGLSEGAPPDSTARLLALRHWAATDPAAAFAWAYQRDGMTSGLILPDSALTLSVWMRSDPAAALAAFADLPFPDRGPLASAMVDLDDEMAGRLLDVHPEVFQEITSTRAFRQTVKSEDANKIVEGILAGSRNPGWQDEAILRAFSVTAGTNPEQAMRIPEPGLRARVLERFLSPAVSALSTDFLREIKKTLPPSLVRSRAAGELARQEAASDPEAVFRWLESNPLPGAERDAIVEQAAGVLADVDPWRMLETTASLSGTVDSITDFQRTQTRKADGKLNSGGYFDSSLENTIDRLLVFAGADDPARAMALLPRVAAKWGAETADLPLHSMLEKVLYGWLSKDPAAARKWADESGIPGIQQKIFNFTNNLEQGRNQP